MKSRRAPSRRSFWSPVWAFVGLTLALSAPTSGQAEPLPLRDRVELGAYLPGLPYFEQSAREFAELERKLGTKLRIASGFVDWDYVFGEPRDVALAKGGERILLYSWEPHCDVGTNACITFASVAAGAHDAYLMRIVESMRRFPHTIYVRPWGEMNAEWSAWQPGSGKPRAGTPEEFVRAWRHVRELFRRERVDNLKFVFNPDAMNDETSTDIARIWPGADYVDVLGIDGYNWGNGAPGSFGKWESFEQIFAEMYGVLTGLHATAPVWICEYGSKEPEKSDGNEVRPAPRDPRNSKGAWIEDMLGSKQFPRVTALVSFNVNKGRDFRFESSADSMRAIRRQLRLRKSAATVRRDGAAVRATPRAPGARSGSPPPSPRSSARPPLGPDRRS
jgi:hypothetical protein